MKRIAYVLVAAVIVAAGALAALPLMLSGEFVRQQIVENVASLTGREITFRDAPRITFNPFLGVELDDVVLADAGAASGKPLVRMERLQGQLRILPAISGRAEIASYRFVRPQFSVEVSDDGKVNWASPKGRIRAVLDEARAKRETTPAGQKPDLSSLAAVSLGRVEIVDGTVEYVDNRSGHKETFTNVNGQFSWPGTLSTWSMSGKCIWRNEAFEFAAGSSQPLMLLSGGTAPATIRLSSSALEFSFDGEANLIADLHLAGAGKLSTPSLRRFAGLFGAALPPGSTLSAFSVSGTLDATPGKLAFKDADIQLDGNSGRGALQLSLAKAMRPKLSGTIAAGQVDLSPYLAEIMAEEAEAAGPPSTLPLLEMEMDLRLSAASATAGKLSLADIAATISLHPNEGVLELGNASVMGGTLTGEVKLRKEGSRYSVNLNAIAGAMDAAAASKLVIPGHFSVSGTAGWQARFVTGGENLKELRQNVTGEVKARIENGVLYGADLSDLLSLAQTGSGETPAAAGQTAFRSLDANVSLDRNFAAVNRITVANSKVTAQIAGRAGLAQRGLALRLLVSPTQPATEGSPQSEARVVIGGSLGSPVFTAVPAINGPAYPPGSGIPAFPEPDPVSLEPAGVSAN